MVRLSPPVESANADRIGERVLVDHWFRDSDDPLNVEKTACIGSERDGGFAEYSAVPQECAHAINSDLSDEELASFPCAYSTAENMVSRPRVASEDTILITGASGGVGSAAIQLCKRRGARVIALASEGKHKALKALGADVVLPREVDDLGAALSPHCDQGHVDVVLDTVSGPQFGNLIHQLRRAGRYASCGAIAGPIVTFDARDLIYNDLEFYGATVLLPGIFENLVQYIEQKEIQPVVSKVFSLADMRAAQEAFLSKTYVGKLVIRVRE